MKEQNIINVRLVAVSASEKYIDGKKIDNYDIFERFIESIGFSDFEHLYPFLIWNVTFWGKSIWASKNMIELEENIHNILFPNIQYEYTNYCAANNITQSNELDKKWLNSRCDSIVMWSHMYYSGDIFITRDNNFHKKEKKKRLLELGAKNIFTPAEACDYLANK
ncbi:hypothetical protein MKX70_20125 [Paenibacillus sp. FSL R7-0312]|uniref:hypothetical protein n=1 Tax=Paenibacillus sp. FSL R7-0312 TaxID=2921682 RepID=UPI0030F62C38